MSKERVCAFLLFILLACLVGCSKNTDTAFTDKELISIFAEHEQVYKRLIDMITSDAGLLQKFQVGPDRLGDYWLYDDGWAKQYGNYVPIVFVLAEYSLTQSRYQDYLNLLSTSEALVVERYKDHVAIIILASGFVFGGCLSQIHYDPNKLELEKPSWAQVYHKVEFNDHWGAETKCN